ncbi:MAG TPA: zf-HC2 domain-containing protein [Armatimonadota bacterium]|nr:zf-HC2 domain-containing protein [Armatimonadota bacterium]
MNCDKYSQLLSESIDGALGPRAEAEARKHVQSCSSCRDELEALRRTVGLLGRFEPRRLSRDFDARLFQRLEAEKGQRSAPALSLRMQWLSRPRALAAAVALLTAGVASWQLYPAASPPKVDSAYLQACVVAHDTAPAVTRPVSPHAAVPDANLTDEEID